MMLLENLAVFASAYAGLACLSVAMDRHYADLYGRGAEPAPATRRQLQAGGALMLLVSLAWAIKLDGGALGLVFWTGGLTGAGLALALLLHYAPRRAVHMALAAGALAALACLALPFE